MLSQTFFLVFLLARFLALPFFGPASTCHSQESFWTAASQQWVQPSNSQTYVLRGTVINSVTGEGIRGALVQSYLNGQISTLTGPDGKFQFEGQPAGQSTLIVRKPGFFTEQELEPSTNNQLVAATGPKTSPVVVRLVPEGVVYGHVSDPDGEPEEGLPISLHVERIQNGRKTWEDVAGGRTDEDGAFRVAELRPGNFFLSAGPSGMPRNFPASESQSGAQGIPVVYYPAGTDLSAAAPIPITPGKKIEIDLTVSSQTLFRIAGSISGHLPGHGIGIQLFNSSGQPVQHLTRFDQATGTFRIPWVSAGAYVLRANSQGAENQNLSATASVNVSADLSGIHLILLPAADIPVQVRVISSRPANERFWEQQKFIPLQVHLVSRSGIPKGQSYYSQQRPENGDPSISIPNVEPGTYQVQFGANGQLYVQSATSGPTNLLESDLSVAAGSSTQPIEVTLRDDAASLSGTVSLDDKPQSASVVVVSEHASVSPLLQPTDPSGNFMFYFLPPGEYKVFALDHPDQVEYANPEILRKLLMKARDVTLSPERSEKIDVELVKAGE